MASKYLNSLSKDEYDNLTLKLHSIQDGKCFICGNIIDLKLNATNVDHIVPLANRGKDSDENFALTHESCNKSKQDANLGIARILHKLKTLQDKTIENSGKAASLKDVLCLYGGSKYDFRYKIENNIITYCFNDIGDNEIISSPLFEDELSKEQTCFLHIPIEYIHHDEIINPRGINNSISKLIKEFDKGNPQLHLTLARINDGKIMVFDGQHKAVAQILLGVKKLPIRLFMNPDIDRLVETNTNAGSSLRQIAFDKSIMTQLNNTLYAERVKKYQQDHNLKEDGLSFSERQLIDYFKGENVNIKKYIIDSLKHSITHHKENKLKDFIDFEGKAKELPISYSAFDKTFLRHFINPKLFLTSPINYRSDEGLNPREVEINQAAKLLSLIAEQIYINKFKPEVGVYRIEKKIIDNKDTYITDDHLVAFRISKEEVIYNWLQYLIKVIENYFNNTGRLFDNQKLFQEKFDDQLWQNIENFIVNLSLFPLWKDRSMASTIFAGKQNYDFWKMVFKTGKTPDGADVLIKPLNFIEMIKPPINC